MTIPKHKACASGGKHQQRKKNMKYTMSLTLTVMVTLFSMCGCTKDENGSKSDDVLSLKKTVYFGHQLKIDGYYYQLYDGKMHNIKFFYYNGVLSDLGSNASFDETASYIEAVKTKVKNLKFCWGLFIIDGTEIKTEKWYPINAGEPLKAYVSSGEILNDTTFKMTQFYRMQNGLKTEVSTISEVYHFKSFNPKPDSTNNFIQ